MHIFSHGRLHATALGLSLVTVLLASGCSSSSGPSFDAASTSSTPVATVTNSAAETSPAATEAPASPEISETTVFPETSEATEQAETREKADNAVAAVNADTALAPEVQSALDTLNTLEVKGRAPKTDYSREQFGQRWADTDHNGCDTRNDILARDLTGITYKTGSRACVVASGILNDPYTGSVISFVRGQETSEAVQIDHVVALSDAWQTGAQQLSAETREAFANDPENLLAVDGPANQQKSDKDAASWLPSNTGYRCTYVSKQIAVKAKYGLWVKDAEKQAMIRVLSDCGAQSETTEQPVASSEAAQVPVREESVEEAPVTGNGQADVYYKNCSEARAAGAAPLYRGAPGYREKMDGDGDGIACEVK